MVDIMPHQRTKLLYYIVYLWMILSTYQIYLFRIAGSYIPLTAIAMLMCLPLINWRKLKDPIAWLFVITIMWNIVSLSWAKIVGLWEYQLVFGYVFIFTYMAFKEIPYANTAFKLIRVFLLFSSLNAILVVLFRLNTGLEDKFINTYLGLFKNPDRLEYPLRINVIDPLKSGGVFDNANTAATLHLACIGFAIMIKNSLQRITYAYLLTINSLAVVMSGSKSALLLLASSLILIFILNFISKRGRDIALRISLLMFSTVIILSIVYIYFTSIANSPFSQETANTTGDRFNLILLAYDLFKGHMVLGLGYGGWQEQIKNLATAYNVDPSWPPHNSIVEAWATSGLVNALLGISIIIILFKRVLTYKPHNTNIQYGLLIALIACIIMPLGDPQPLLGAAQVSAPLGIACSFFHYYIKHQQTS
jgi:hypothetical protein